jgi:hypothetical protein
MLERYKSPLNLTKWSDVQWNAWEIYSLSLSNTSVGQEYGYQQKILLILWFGRTHNYNVTNISVIPCIRALLQKPMFAQLAKKLWRNYFLLHKNFNVSQSCDRQQSQSSHFISLDFISILPSQIVSFFQFTPPQHRMHLSFSHTCHMTCPPHPPWPDHSNNILHAVPIMNFLSVQLPLLSCQLNITRNYIHCVKKADRRDNF